MPSTKPETDTANPERALDRALKDTFPASDPPAATSFTPPVSGNTAPDEEDTVAAWLVISRGCADKPLEQWRSCGQSRWVSQNVPALFASLTPAAALLEALVNQDLAEASDAWGLVCLRLPAEAMSRLDTPPDSWRERLLLQRPAVARAARSERAVPGRIQRAAQHAAPAVFRDRAGRRGAAGDRFAPAPWLTRPDR